MGRQERSSWVYGEYLANSVINERTGRPREDSFAGFMGS
jgi:hypothetical protein